MFPLWWNLIQTNKRKKINESNHFLCLEVRVGKGLFTLMVIHQQCFPLWKYTEDSCSKSYWNKQVPDQIVKIYYKRHHVIKDAFLSYFLGIIASQCSE